MAFVAAVSVAWGQRIPDAPLARTAHWIGVGPVDSAQAANIVLEKVGHEIGLEPPASILYLATWENGVFRSPDQGANWTPFNDGLPNYPVTSLAIAQRTITLGAPLILYETALYAGTNGGGLFRFASGWKPVGGGLIGSEIFAIVAVSIDVVYVATETGTFKTQDAGASWTQVSDGLPPIPVRALAVDPRSTEMVFAGIFDGVGSQIFRSSDGGRNWVAVLSLSDLAVTSLGIAPSSPAAIFVATENIGVMLAIPQISGQVFRSMDGGTTWTRINDPRRGLPIVWVTTFAFDPLTPAVYAGTWGDGVFRSTDAGDTWVRLWAGPTVQFATTLALDSAGRNLLLYAGAVSAPVDSGGPVFRLTDRRAGAVPFREPR